MFNPEDLTTDGTTPEEVENARDRAEEAWTDADSAIDIADRRGEEETPTETKPGENNN